MKNMIIPPNLSIREAMKVLSKSAEKCLVVANHDNILLGTITDGDIRKAILNGIAISESIKSVYNSCPTVVLKDKYNIKEIKKIFLNKKFSLLPLVNNDNKIIDVLLWEKIFSDDINFSKKQLGNVPVIIMAGGKGTRLEPFTKILPKPLIPIHEKPVIQHIIEKFSDYGIKNYYLTINYKGHILKAFFEEIQSDNNFEFFEEKSPLGTAGSMYHFRNKFTKPFFVTNCDILINDDYYKIYDYHKKNNFSLTLVASAKEFTIPYGTCEINEHGHLSHINEKPQYDFLVNTGLYVLNPNVLNMIPKDKFFHITDLIKKLKEDGEKVGIFPIDDDDWSDIGQWNEYKKAIDKLN